MVVIFHWEKNRLHKKSVTEQHIQGQYKYQHIHSYMRLYNLHEHTGKRNSNVHGCQVPFGY